jgi:signal transduction histidine kinase
MIIVTVPLLIQGAVFAFYQKLLNDTDQIASIEDHEKSVIGQVNWISTQVLAADLGATAYRLTGDRRLLDVLDDADTRLKREVKEAAGLFADNKRQSDLTSAAAREIMDLLNLLSAQVRKDRPAVSHSAIEIDDERNMQAVKHLFDLRHELLANEIAKYNFSMAHTPQYRHRGRDWAGAGILLAALGAMLTYAGFSRTITKRLAVLTNNLGRFSQGSELNPLVGGDDEVSVLDKSFHDMVRALKLAQQRKQEYLQMLNHDLRTPISNVLVSLELIERTDPGTTESSKTHLVTAEKNLERALGLINQILEIESMEAGVISLTYDAITSTELCSKAIDSVKYLALKPDIRIEQFDAAVDFVADLDRLLQVMINILGNAIKFSSEHSKIIVSSEARQGFVKISVRDQGRGIPAEALGRVFERFQQVQAEDQKSGSGLGLAVCRAIIEAHGGKIGVDSKVGEGTTFWFEIPDEPPATSQVI